MTPTQILFAISIIIFLAIVFRVFKENQQPARP
jgi:hypothetical protein